MWNGRRVQRCISNKPLPCGINALRRLQLRWNRKAHKSGLTHWMNGLSNWIDECLSLGVATIDGDESNADKSGRDARFHVDSNYVV